MCQLAAIQSALALREEKKKNEEGKKKEKCPELEFRIRFGCDVLRASAAAARQADAAPCVRACVRVSETLRVWLLFISPAARERLV